MYLEICPSDGNMLTLEELLHHNASIGVPGEVFKTVNEVLRISIVVQTVRGGGGGGRILNCRAVDEAPRDVMS